jgi:hypothetical protein
MKRLLGFTLATLLGTAPAFADSGFPIVSTADTNSTLIVKGSHFLTSFSLGNNSTAAWIKFYNTATAPTCGAGTPYVFAIPGNASLAGSNFEPPGPLLFTLGIGYCITGGAGNSDTTAVGSGQVTGTVLWR